MKADSLLSGRMLRLFALTALSIVITHLFFYEYRAGARRLQIPYDLEGYHYPLADYAFQRLQNGDFPEWDPTMYSGLPYAANVQAALFYPPTWLMLLANSGAARMRYQTLQDTMFVHIAAAFVFTWLWFRWKRLHWMACLMGGAVFAFNGYVMHQLQHFGLVAGYTWLPLGLWAVDRLHAGAHRVRSLSQLAVASALCFLAGYPPFWVVFAICMMAYAAARRAPIRTIVGTGGALVTSLLLCAVQLLPTMEASGLMVRENRYGSGFRDPWFYLSYFVPNYYQFELGVPVHTNPGYALLYLGGIGIAGILLSVLNRDTLRGIVPAAAIAAACSVFLVNPFDIVSDTLAHWPFAGQIVRDYYFLAGFAPAAAIMTAAALHQYFTRPSQPSVVSNWLAAGVAAATLIWCARLILLWRTDGLSHGPWSVVDGIAATVLCILLVVLYCRCEPYVRAAATLSIILLTATELKVFGAGKRVNATETGTPFAMVPFPGLDDAVYETMLSHPVFRSAVDYGGPLTTSLRHVGLETPQGFDPLLPQAYRSLIETRTTFRTDREFEIPPSDIKTLQLSGVRFYITTEQAPAFELLREHPSYRPLEPSSSYFKVFELQQATPPFGWEQGDAGDVATATAWEPEHRVMQVRSADGGTFRLSEQYFPGWSARVDGASVAIARCHFAYQCVVLPPGAHTVTFEYRSTTLRLGAAISGATTSALLLVVWLGRRRKQKLV